MYKILVVLFKVLCFFRYSWFWRIFLECFSWMTLQAILTKVETISPYFHLLDAAPNVRLPDNQTNAIIVSIWVRPFWWCITGNHWPMPVQSFYCTKLYKTREKNTEKKSFFPKLSTFFPHAIDLSFYLSDPN